MNQHFKISKTIFFITLFLFLFGIGIVVSHSNIIYQWNVGSEAIKNTNHVSALSPKKVEDFEQDKILLLYDPVSKESLQLKDHFEKTLQYMQKSYEMATYLELPKETSSYQNIAILFPDLDQIDDFPIFTKYVSKGGKLLFAVRPDVGENYQSMHEMLGIKQSHPSFTDSFGIEMRTDLLLQSKGMALTDEDNFFNESLEIELEETSTVHALTEHHVPLLFSTPYKNGEFMVFNGTMLSEKVNRGIIAGALSNLNEDYIYPIMNSKVVYIDDFPAPFPEGKDDKIYHDYKRNIADFFHDIWWPDMLKKANKYDMKYTGLLIETYNDKVTGPFEEHLAEENLKMFGRDLIKMGGELGVHGYNHQALTKDQEQVATLGYKAWEDESDMVNSLKEVDQHIQSLFPNYTLQTYVPPSNVLSEDGKETIKEGIPSITNIASSYIPDGEKIAYIQEYEATEDYNEIPRLTSDYHYNSENKWTIANSATLFGAFSHFIHPDDILDEERSKSMNWKQLSSNLDHMFRDVNEKYPWMKEQTAAESAESLIDYKKADVFISQEEDKIKGYINQFSGNLDLVLRSKKKIKRTDGCEVERISEDRYLVHALSTDFTIELEENE